MLKIFTDKTLSFLYCYLSISFSPSLPYLLLSPLFLCFSFFPYSHFLHSFPLIIYPLLFFFLFSLFSCSLFFLFPPFIIFSSPPLSFLFSSLFCFSTSYNSNNCFCNFNIITLFSITCFNNLIASFSPTSLINPFIFTWLISIIFVAIISDNFKIISPKIISL